MDIVNKFKSLCLKNAAVSRFIFVPNEKLLLELLLISEDQQVSSRCELEFHRVLHATVNIKTNNFFGEIQDFFASSDSHYLSEIVEKIKPVFVPMDRFYFFSVSTENGKFDVIAEDFKFATICRNEIIGTRG